MDNTSSTSELFYESKDEPEMLFDNLNFDNCSLDGWVIEPDCINHFPSFNCMDFESMVAHKFSSAKYSKIQEDGVDENSHEVKEILRCSQVDLNSSKELREFEKNEENFSNESIHFSSTSEKEIKPEKKAWSNFAIRLKLAPEKHTKASSNCGKSNKIIPFERLADEKTFRENMGVCLLSDSSNNPQEEAKEEQNDIK